MKGGFRLINLSRKDTLYLSNGIFIYLKIIVTLYFINNRSVIQKRIQNNKGK